MMKTQASEKRSEAAGHLMAAADEAERLVGVLSAMQQIVKARVDRTDLVGGPMAQTIEDLAGKIVADVWLAVRANEAAADAGKV